MMEKYKILIQLGKLYDIAEEKDDSLRMVAYSMISKELSKTSKSMYTNEEILDAINKVLTFENLLERNIHPRLLGSDNLTQLIYSIFKHFN